MYWVCVATVEASRRKGIAARATAQRASPLLLLLMCVWVVRECGTCEGYDLALQLESGFKYVKMSASGPHRLFSQRVIEQPFGW